ncbi:MAG: outer membrane beta-barrel protein [Acidobacteria bacterium]|nr:outer membrane beta-barrel protein [Acidobacteriota bacterium]
MGKAVLRAGLLLLLPVALLAQTNGGLYGTPKAELSTGYSYVRIEGSNLHGWNVSLAGNVNRNLGIVGDFAGHYSDESATSGAAVISSNLTLTSLMAGPRVSERTMRWVTPFAHALFGMTRVNAEVTVEQPGVPTSSASNDVTGFSTALGGGLDINMSQGLALRLFQVDYLIIRSDGFKHEGVRASAGIVWRIGQRTD